MWCRHAHKWEGKVKETRYIRIGNQTALAASSITEPFRYAIVKGFDAFEWFPDKNESGKGWTESSIKKKARALIRKIAADHDINLSVHTPWQVNPLKLKDREALIRNVEFAIDIGATLINTHFFSEKGVDAYVEAVTPLIQLLSKEGIKLSIENTPTTGPEVFNKLLKGLV
jgi:sugar phosphate isomerase/epimerase